MSFTFFQIHRMYTTVNTKGKLWTYSVLWCVNVSLSLIKKKKSTILVSDFDYGRRYACVGTKDIWETSEPSLNFVINQKLPWNKIKTSPKMKYNFKKNLGKSKQIKPKSSRRKIMIKTKRGKKEIKKGKTIEKNQWSQKFLKRARKLSDL